MTWPAAKETGLITESVDEGLVVYDEEAQVAHALAPVAAGVWELCDGMRSMEQIAVEMRLDENTVGQALDELEACGLLLDSAPAANRFSRRDAARKLAGVAGAAFAGPLIYSAAIPAAAAAGSTCTTGKGAPCTVTYSDNSCSTVSNAGTCAAGCACAPSGACTHVTGSTYTRTGSCA